MGKRIRKAEGYLICPEDLTSGDYKVDEDLFFEGRTLEESIKGHFEKITVYLCLNCDNWQFEKDLAESCCEKGGV